MTTKLERKDNTFRGLLGSPVMEIKEVSETGEFEGYGSVFGMEDRGGDTVEPGAFKASLAAMPAGKVKMLWQHDPHQPIGVWSEMYEDSKGLYCKGKLLTSVSKGRECYELLKSGAIEGLSIGYRTKRAERINEADGDYRRKLIEVELWEVSVVTFPMNTHSNILGVKRDGDLPTERDLERYLKDGGFSATEAKAIIAEGYKNFLAARDAGGGMSSKTVRDAGGDDAELQRLLTQAAAMLRG